MIVTDRAAVSLGVDAGGKDANSATVEHYMALRRLLESECPGPYSEAIKEVALVLRIDGSVQAWGLRGVDHVRLQKKGGYATADIFIPAEVWEPRDREILRSYLAAEVRVAVTRIVERIVRARIPFETDRLLKDVVNATEKFLKSIPH